VIDILQRRAKIQKQELQEEGEKIKSRPVKKSVIEEREVKL